MWPSKSLVGHTWANSGATGISTMYLKTDRPLNQVNLFEGQNLGNIDKLVQKEQNKLTNDSISTVKSINLKDKIATLIVSGLQDGLFGFKEVFKDKSKGLIFRKLFEKTLMGNYGTVTQIFDLSDESMPDILKKLNKNMICCVTNKGFFLLFNLQRRRIKLLLVHSSKNVKDLQSSKVVYNTLNNTKEEIENGLGLFSSKLEILCLYWGGKLMSEDLIGRSQELIWPKIQTKDILFSFVQTGSKYENGLTLKLANTKSELFSLEFTKEKSKYRIVNVFEKVHDFISRAFGDFKLHWIQDLDLKSLECCTSLNQEQRKLAIQYFKKFWFVNCKDGCKIVFIDGQVKIANKFLGDSTALHNLRMIPIMPHKFDDGVPVLAQMTKWLAICTMANSIIFELQSFDPDTKIFKTIGQKHTFPFKYHQWYQYNSIQTIEVSNYKSQDWNVYVLVGEGGSNDLHVFSLTLE